uniref:Uncharacterized protein n=1 Tax=Lepeophtheirus salmonis TaxID=72036 RepID=A0A0K2TKU1_LEPSM
MFAHRHNLFHKRCHTSGKVLQFIKHAAVKYNKFLFSVILFQKVICMQINELQM